MFKKIVMAGVLTFTTLSTSVFAYANDQVRPTDKKVVEPDEFDIQYLENTDTYQKIKFTNTKTQEVEYLEVVIEENKTEYTAQFDNKEVVVTRGEDYVTEHDLQTNEVKFTDLKAEPNEQQSKLNDVGILAVPAPVDPGQYTYSHSITGSRSTDVAAISLVAGIIASIYGGPVIGTCTTIATYLWGIKAKNVWYKSDHYLWRDSYHYPASYTKYYAYPDYTNFINSIWKTVNH